MKGKPPSRYFFHNGTKYVFTGNERLAMSHFHELRAHLSLMKMTNIQKLPIIFGTKEFDDGTTARFQLIHGQEYINVFAPRYIKTREKEFEKVLIEESEMIVPTIITYNAAGQFIGFTICKSGTFEPPYQFFPNQTAFPSSNWFTDREAFLEANLEDYPKDKLKLSQDLVFDDEIFLISPDGEYPTENSDFNSFAPTGSDDQPGYINTVGDGPEMASCGEGFCIRYFHINYNVDVATRFVHTELWGNEIPIRSGSEKYTLTGFAYWDDLAFAGSWNCDSADYYMGLAQDYWSYTTEGNLATPTSGIYPQNLYQTWINEVLEFPGYYDSITAKRDNTANFASCYVVQKQTTTQYEHQDVSVCEYPGVKNITKDNTYTLYLNVKSNEYQLDFFNAAAIGNWFQYEGGLRYYSSRTLCAVLTWFYDDPKTVYTYHHYSAESGNIVSTEFQDPDGRYDHKIADLTYQNEPIYGKGEVILCRYVDKSKKEIKIK